MYKTTFHKAGMNNVMILQWYVLIIDLCLLIFNLKDHMFIHYPAQLQGVTVLQVMINYLLLLKEGQGSG